MNTVNAVIDAHWTAGDEVRLRNYCQTERAVATGRSIVIFFLVLYVNVLKPRGWPILLFDCVLLFAAGYNIFILVYTRHVRYFSTNLTFFSMYGDMAAVAVGIFFTGGAQSPFLFIWYLTLFTAGTRFGFLKSLLLQVPMGGFYWHLVSREYPSYGEDAVNHLSLGLFSLVAVSAFGALLSREEKNTLDALRGYHRESITDRLTGLYNYAFFVDELKKEFDRSARMGSEFSLIIFDLDHFKRVNDVYGHEKGNIVLKGVATVLTTNARTYDTIARYGGEEFVIIMPGCDAASDVADRLREKVEATSFPGITKDPFHITISGGICAYPADATSFDDLLDKADQALYEAKKQGRNRVCAYAALAGSAHGPNRHVDRSAPTEG